MDSLHFGVGCVVGYGTDPLSQKSTCDAWLVMASIKRKRRRRENRTKYSVSEEIPPPCYGAKIAVTVAIGSLRMTKTRERGLVLADHGLDVRSCNRCI
jgi:hypothetical protein